jgi:hypothetical protein
MERSSAERWALALAGISTQTESKNINNQWEIGGWNETGKSAEWCRNVLKKLYGVESREQLDSAATYIAATGDTASARELLSASGGQAAADYQKGFVQSHRDEIARRGLLAWDLARMVTIAGWGKLGGYLSEDEYWARAMPAAQRIQITYDSWRSYADGYKLGQLFWSQGQEHPPTNDAIAALLSDPHSPWVTLPWNTPLDRSASNGDPVLFPGQRIARLSDYVELMRRIQRGDLMGALAHFGLDMGSYAQVMQAWGMKIASDPALGTKFAQMLAGR